MSVTIIRQDTGDRWTIDHVESESWDKPIEVTDHPIEDGSQASDHLQEESIRVSVTAYVAENAPPRGFKQNEENRHLKAVEFFRKLAEDAPLVTYVSNSRGSVEDMLIDERPYTFDKRKGVEIDLAFKRLELAVAEQVKIPPEQPPPDQEGQSDQQDQGKNGSEKEDEERRCSDLKRKASGPVGGPVSRKIFGECAK